MGTTIELIVTVVVSIIGSGGFWAFLTAHREKKSATTAMVLGLGFSQLMQECQKYMDRGYIYPDELDSLTKYLYDPYKKLGGNGVAERIYKSVLDLPNSKPEQ